MKPVSNGAKAVFAVAFALFLAVVLVGIALSDHPVKKFFKQQEVLDIAKMHMSQVRVIGKKVCPEPNRNPCDKGRLHAGHSIAQQCPSAPPLHLFR